MISQVAFLTRIVQVECYLFLLNNKYARSHKQLYQKRGNAVPIFDISEKQLRSSVNEDWQKMEGGALVCVVGESLKMSTIYRIEHIDTVDHDEEFGDQFVVWGDLVAKFVNELSYTSMLNKHSVNHPRLRDNKFPIGFNVADLGKQMSSVEVRTRDGVITLGSLE